jgi:hypothetical protein
VWIGGGQQPKVRERVRDKHTLDEDRLLTDRPGSFDHRVEKAVGCGKEKKEDRQERVRRREGGVAEVMDRRSMVRQ